MSLLHPDLEPQDEGYRTIMVTLCDPCYLGAGGECHSPACAFWCCPAPSGEQADRLRSADHRSDPDPEAWPVWSKPSTRPRVGQP